MIGNCKVRFLKGSVSQTGLFGDAIGNMALQFPAAQEQTEAIQHILPRRAAAAFTCLALDIGRWTPMTQANEHLRA